MTSSTDPYHSMDLLRFTTAGSVDDGKSTLIGRLLYDTKSIFEDQLAAIEQTSKRRGEGYVNLALLTDGLRAEREQNITIDVAYRYFATPKRKFIIADTPGHVQYTRNMVTGASTAELAIVLIDARKGVVTQSRRHGFIASLLGIPHILVAVNKMDAVDYSEEAFNRIVADYSDFAAKLSIKDLVFIPISALVGDNIVTHSAKMPWYEGSTLLHHLETVNVGADRNLVDFRFPVQYVVRPHQDFRGFAGRISSGVIRTGEEVVVLPGGQSSRVTRIVTAGGELDEAAAGDSVVLTIEGEIEAGRGSMIVRKQNVPTVATRLEAMVCWLNEAPLDLNTRYVLVHTSRQVQAMVSRVVYRMDMDTLHRENVTSLGINDIARIQLVMSQPVFVDPYQQNRTTGSFVLVDPRSNNTVAAGMIRGEWKEASSLFPEPTGVPSASPNVVWEGWNISREVRQVRNGHKAAVLWFTGLSGSGKSTIARGLERRLFERGCHTMLLDGDTLRHGLNADLKFGAADRTENIRRVGEVARLFFEQGAIVLCTFVSPFRKDRDAVRAKLPDGRFIEVYVKCSLDEAMKRDPKGLYAKAKAGEIPEFTGISSPYEEPEHPEAVADSDARSAASIVDELVDRLDALGLLSRINN
ncbi:MAG TPA: sulfate adenylyltransferase subunit CysN [Gemmatimonadaceae bacterium]